VSISFAEAYAGKEITLRSREGEQFRVRVPAGIDSGGKVRVVGRGEPGINGGPPGDLIVHVTVQDHPYFERRGDNIYLTVPVTFSEAALGTTVEIPTMTGRVQLRIPAGTPGGKELRLRGKGFPHLGGPAAGRGDQIVHVEIVVPHELDMRSRELLRELAQLNPGDPRTGRWS
jgi:DnaJ-class molecular chaperone